jgi:putrescine transport system permease protein
VSLHALRPGRRAFRAVIAGIPLAWLGLFFLAPFALVLTISVADPVVGQPPYAPLLARGADGALQWQGTLDNYRALFADGLYLQSYLGALRIALVSTVLCLLVGYPMAYAIARLQGAWRTIALLLVILPFWSSFLLRVYAWMGLLGTHGTVNGLLLALGWIERPLALMYNDFAVYLGIVYTYLPFMILPLYAVLERHEQALGEAAQDLGARPLAVFLDVTLPLSVPGIVAGSLLVFVPAIGEFVIPSLLGGLDTLMIGRTLYDEFFINRDWPLAAAVATVLLAIVVLPVVLFQRGRLQEHP